LSETLKKMMAKTQGALAKGDEKQRLEKEATAATFIDLTKKAIEVQMKEVAAKLFAEEN
jgi:hypothetical protein